MEIRYNATGQERKKLVETIAAILECDAKYMGAPSFAYTVGFFTIDKEGTVSFDDRADTEEVEHLIEALAEKGFTAQERVAPTDGLCIELPLAGVTEAAVDRLRMTAASKAALIIKALGADSIEIDTNVDTIRFPWFEHIPTPEITDAAEKLICRMLEMAKKQKRVTAREKQADNEKYAFRCFLLRLGFIGAEYKDARKALLANFSGSSAFKSGHKKEAAEAEPVTVDTTTEYKATPTQVIPATLNDFDTEGQGCE